MMTEKLRMESPYTAPNSLDREIYPLHWRHGGVDVPIDISGLPSIDHALYLFNTVKFHLDSSYRFFEEEAFLGHVHEFYHGDALRKASECRLWFVQFLLVLAFGNAFLLQSRDPKGPPGSKFFVRAMSLMPDHASLWKEGLLAVEVLALCGLYLYCIDHRESAHVYVRMPCLFHIRVRLADTLGLCRLARLFGLRRWTGCTQSSPKTNSVR
jgi:proline utilization trans-activator